MRDIATLLFGTLNNVCAAQAFVQLVNLLLEKRK